MCGVCRRGADTGELCGWGTRKSVGKGAKKEVEVGKNDWDFHRYP